MSTHVEPEIDTPAEATNTQPLSLAGLVATLGAQQGRPRLEQIYDWLESAEISREDLEPYLGFKEGNYWRHRICRNEFAEMLVLCWRPGHKTPIHDHNGSHGVVRVHEGIMWETTFHFDVEKGLCYKSGQQRSQGEVTGSDIPDIHQLGNPEVSGQDLITIHIYAPPLGVLKTYKVGSPVIDLYTPDESQTTNGPECAPTSAV